MQGNMGMIGMIAIYAVIIGLVYLFLLRPNSKKKKEEAAMRNNLEIGDEITTIGGIVGRVIAVRDDDETFIVETGSDKTRMRFKKWAIASVDTPDKQPQKKDAKGADEKEDKKEKKSRRNRKDDEDEKRSKKNKYDE